MKKKTKVEKEKKRHPTNQNALGRRAKPKPDKTKHNN